MKRNTEKKSMETDSKGKLFTYDLTSNNYGLAYPNLP
jgi:hypothetical protein